MAYENNHYVPQFILRRFGDKINRYNIETGEVRIKRSLTNSFSSKKIYPEWLEHMFSSLEARVAHLIDNKILKTNDTVTLSREENWLLKKFFAIATLRVPDINISSIRHLDPVESLKERGFKEVSIEDETNEEYYYRTMKVILESDDLDEVYNHPETTYEACNWATLFYCCYVAIWDSKKVNEDLIITDCGMNCEHDKSRFKTYNFDGKYYRNDIDEMLKIGYLLNKYNEEQEQNKKKLYLELFRQMYYVHANYYLFAVSKNRTISLVNPFFKLYSDEDLQKTLKEVPNIQPSLLSNATLSCNTRTYESSSKQDKNDLFHYKIKDLSLDEVIIINCMMLDRVYRWLGFDSSTKIARSLNVYSMIPQEYRRKNYDKLIEHLYLLGCDFPKTRKYQNISEKLFEHKISEEEIKYIKYFYDEVVKKK